MNNPTLIDELALLGLKSGDQNGRTAPEIRKALTPFLNRRESELLSALQRLVANGHVEEVPPGKGKRSKRWRLLQSASEAPAIRTSRTAKQKAVRRLVAVHVLNLGPRDAEAIIEGDGLSAYYLAGSVGETFDVHTTLVGLARLVAARKLDISRGDPDFVWEILTQKGLDAVVPADSGESENAPQAKPPAAPNIGSSNSDAQNERENSIGAFADQVKNAARTAKTEWYGSGKLFIHRAWEAWKKGSGESADLPAFKQRLVEALRAGHIELSRADFPMSLEANDLQTALTHYGDERFHFVNFEEDARP